MIAGRLTHRAAVERNVAVGTDAYGDAAVPDFQPLHAALPCFAWSRQSRESVDGGKSVLIEDIRALFALDADIRAGDVITRIEKRNGDLVMDGRLKIEGEPQFKHSHREAALQRIG